MSTYPDGTRDCKTCKRRLPLEEFWFENRKANRRHYRCKECHGFYIKSWVSGNPEKRKKITQRYGIRHEMRFKRYGITMADYDDMLASQHYSCAICHLVAKGRELHIDHCHNSGKIRGLLCDQCNTGIGKLRHSPENALRAARYLRATA